MWPPLPPQQRKAHFSETLDAARRAGSPDLNEPETSIHHGNVLVSLDRFIEQLFRASVANASGNFHDLIERVKAEAPHVVHRVDLNKLRLLHRSRNKAQHQDGSAAAMDVVALRRIAEQIFINSFVVPPSEQASQDTMDRFFAVMDEIRNIAQVWCRDNAFVGAMGYSGEYLYLSRLDPRYDRLIEGIRSIRDGVAREDELVELISQASEMLTRLTTA